MSEPTSLTPEILVTRLGDYLVERGWVSVLDLQQALDRQEELRQKGLTPPLLGKILVQMGLIDQSLLDQAITEQIIQLKTALQDANRRLERRVQERTADLELALQKLSELSQLKSDFVSNISHELRTPLTHIKGYLELLYEEELGQLQPDQTRALSVMLRSLDRLERLIEDLINFSMTERGQITLNMRPFDLSFLSQKIAAETMVKAEAHDLQFTWENVHENLIIRADEEKIHWTIAHLLDNAIKFTPAGGKIHLIIDRNDRFVTVRVQDTGIGIPPDKLAEIFEPFHQLEGGATRRYGGTGLGLALVRNIAEAHGARIQVTSETGKGSEFSFELKLVE